MSFVCMHYERICFYSINQEYLNQVQFVNENLLFPEKSFEKTMQTVDNSIIRVETSEEIESTEEIPEETILSVPTSVNLVPFIGQRFVSQDAAYEFYCTFAKQCGFSIRRHRTRGKDGVGRGVTRRDFTCHRSGFPQTKKSDDNRLHRNRRSSRCGCQAYMRIVKRAEFDIPEWRITGFSNVHNHELFRSNEAHELSGYYSISTDDKSRICMFAKAGLSVRQMLRLLELEKGVKLGCLPFTEIDVRNLLKTFRNADDDNDAIDLVSMCKRIKDEDPNFKYEFEIDANNRLEHIAWSYASSVRSYDAYGDVVIFDTTRVLDAYDMILGIWIGVDNHGMNCFFGCALLRDENVQSFSWALKAATIIEPKDQEKGKQKSERRLHKISLKSGSPIESHAASILTPYAFCKLQEELVLAPQFASFPIEDNCLLVRHHTQVDGGCQVIWKPNEEVISCSCRQFEFSGTLCRHALRVLSASNCFQIPEKYLPSRWRSVSLPVSKENTERVNILQSMASTLLSESIDSEECLEVASEQISLALSRIREISRSSHGLSDVGYGSPSESLIIPEGEDIDGLKIGHARESYPLGKLKERGGGDEIEMSRKRRRCPAPCCVQFGHDSRDCPMIGSEGLSEDDLGFL
ncbi:protein FAR1-RELATED SEQUENCE 11-like isoform X4 [Asparagus officinalis]|uniref:protein FAR1-RELATED SEQUENCE 11-like isoform X4 n=1 Tax=Asparagus officinalis TaxID=4686 RepID=UPI00098E02D5|nr:protein FAR1-RELATED SEQUENCE 11-like isoform X4 [Asparagus officinalis]